MHNPTPYEISAMMDAAEKAGQFLDKLGTADMATMDYDQWMNFIEEVCTGFCDGMRLRGGMVMMDMTLNNGLPPLCEGDTSTHAHG